ncbi:MULTISPECIES: hypothetical protein [unclassified Nocardioides]|uniref:hypothetical protein n=1 Tax=unclassified Nocardioides TaxID=2615069 RepID=UPI0006FBA62D|nr:MULTISPECIES: hypothetical protein [unclassified Nocardioides]KQY63968.1 hypothetical protein ASD30_03035 [Nocardioides sp. Root140]KRF15982.1 hypothetical protein ASH02_05040 [Nocardioides sp. Soil796]
MTLSRLGLLASALLVPVLVACGTATDADDPATGGPTGMTDRPSGPVTYAADITALTQSGPGRVTVTLDLPAGAPGCARHPKATVEAEKHAVFLTATFQSLAATLDYDAHACPKMQPHELSVDIPELDGRTLVTDNSVEWKPGNGPSYVRCDDQVGCYPPNDRCDPAWTGTLLQGVEIPPEQQVDVLACEGSWMVAEVDAVMTGCQSVDGSTPPAGCVGKGTHTRFFAHFTGERWNAVATGTAAGCADVASVPSFPRTLCRALPAR